MTEQEILRKPGHMTPTNQESTQDGQYFFAHAFLCLKPAYFWNAARTVRSPGFLSLALQRAVVRFCESCFRPRDAAKVPG
jgi:hypothetical protein